MSKYLLTVAVLLATPALGYESAVQCKTYPANETTIVKLPPRVAAFVICTAPGTTRAGVPIISVTMFGVTRRGKTYCTTDMQLETTLGRVITVERNECGYPP